MEKNGFEVPGGGRVSGDAGMVLPLGESIFFVVNLKKNIFIVPTP